MSLTWGHLRMAGISEHQHEQLLSTQKYLALLDLHFWEHTRDFQGQATRRSKSPYLSQLLLWAWSSLGFCAESCKKLSWDTTEERKDGVQGKSGDSRPRSPGAWLKPCQALKEPWGRVAIPTVPQPQLLALCGCRPRDCALQITREKPHVASARWGSGEQLALLTLWLPVPGSLAQEPWAEQGVFLFAQRAALFTLEQDQAAFARTGALLGRPKTMSFALCRNKPSVQNYGQMNTDLHWYSNGITVLFSQISNEQIWAMLFVLVLKLTLQNLKYTLPFFFYALGMYVCM